VRDMILLSNSKKTVIAGLEGYGLKVIERRGISAKGEQ